MIVHPRLLILAAALAQLCCAGRTAMVNGRAVPYEQASADEFGAGKQAYSAGHFDDAASAFAKFLQDFPDSDLADEARFRRGQSLAHGGKLQDAQSSLQELLAKYPNSHFKHQATLELGLVQGQLGEKAESAQTLKPMVAEMSELLSSLGVSDDDLKTENCGEYAGHQDSMHGHPETVGSNSPSVS